MLLVAAISGVDDLDQYARKYIQSIFPTEKTNEEMVEKYRDIVEAEGQKEYTVVSQDS